MNLRQNVNHSIKPFIDRDSKILILGSFPSVKSRESQFFYGHPQNRFWKVLSIIFNDNTPKDVEEKKSFLKKHKIALYDVIESCSISGSSDSSIKDVVPVDISKLIENTDIKVIGINGKLAYNYFLKYNKDLIGKYKVISLPSTSPANARSSLNDLAEIWKEIL